MLKLMSWYLLSILLVVFLHEFIHYGIAFFLGCNPAIHFDKYLTPIVSYRNRHHYLKILIISASAPLFLVAVGIMISPNIWMIVMKCMCLANILNFIPITADGEAILYALLHLEGVK